jgi:hypothetical protein
MSWQLEKNYTPAATRPPQGYGQRLTCERLASQLLSQYRRETAL